MYLVQCHDCKVFTTAEKLWVRLETDRAIGVCETCGQKTAGEPIGDRLYVLEAADRKSGTADGARDYRIMQPGAKPKPGPNGENRAEPRHLPEEP